MDDSVQQDELQSLKQRANQLGVAYHPNIGVDKLREKVNARIKGEASPSEEEPEAESTEQAVAPAEPVESIPRHKQQRNESLAQFRQRRRKEASELVRIRITCMNPNKKEWDGEIFTTGNAIVGTYRKYVPFTSDEPYHVPRIIYEQILDRRCQVFTKKKDGRGGTKSEGKLIKEFSVEVLPNLTPKELEELRQRQAMARGQ